MKKVPRPDVIVTDTIVRLEWGFFAIEMHEDEALVMARCIHDALEERDLPCDTTPTT